MAFNNMNNNNISSSEIQYILEGCRDDMRLDGRSCTDYRFYNLVKSPLALSHGSARLLCQGGGTQILCSVKADLVRPASNNPNQGMVEVHVDHKRQRFEDVKLESILGRVWLPHSVDLEGLCVIPKLYVWRLNIDLLVLASMGNVVDVCVMVMRAALQQTLLPKIVPLKDTTTSSSSTMENNSAKKNTAMSDLAMDSDIQNALHVPSIDKCPLVVSIYIVKCPTTKLLLDPTPQEEACASCQVSIAVFKDEVYGISKHNVGSISVGMLPKITSLAIEASQHMLKMCNESQEAPQDGLLLQDYYTIR